MTCINYGFGSSEYVKRNIRLVPYLQHVLCIFLFKFYLGNYLFHLILIIFFDIKTGISNQITCKIHKFVTSAIYRRAWEKIQSDLFDKLISRYRYSVAGQFFFKKLILWIIKGTSHFAGRLTGIRSQKYTFFASGKIKIDFLSFQEASSPALK